MTARTRTLMQLVIGAAALAITAGCGDDREHRTVIIREEQHEGEVREVSPAGRTEGDGQEVSRPQMIVE